MTAEEKKKYERQTESFSIGYKYEPPKEKAVKINVKAVKHTAVEETVEAKVLKVSNEEEDKDDGVEEISKGLEAVEIKEHSHTAEGQGEAETLKESHEKEEKSGDEPKN